MKAEEFRKKFFSSKYFTLSDIDECMEAYHQQEVEKLLDVKIENITATARHPVNWLKWANHDKQRGAEMMLKHLKEKAKR